MQTGERHALEGHSSDGEIRQHLTGCSLSVNYRAVHNSQQSDCGPNKNPNIELFICETANQETERVHKCRPSAAREGGTRPDCWRVEIVVTGQPHYFLLNLQAQGREREQLSKKCIRS